MILVNIISFICLWTIVVAKNDTETCTCPIVPKHYEELNCVPITKNGDCCPSSFDCSAYQNRNKTVCHYNGRVFLPRQELHDGEIESSCTIGCFCREGDAEDDLPALFTCTHIDCPEFFGPSLEQSGKDCIRQYESGRCCSKGTVCGEDVKKLAKCEFNGKTYYEGQNIDTGRSCYTCICGKGFENKPVEENKHCKKVHCLIELHYNEKLSDGCIPIYWKKEDCCPIEFRCPNDNTVVIPDKTRTQKKSDLNCNFGNLKMSIGDILSPESEYDNCTTCTCSIPPYPTCIKKC